MKTILTTDKANKPFGYLQLDEAGNFIVSQSISSSYSPVQLLDITDNTSSHFVGINNTNPQFTLDVSGSINFTDTLLQNGLPYTASLANTSSYSISASYAPFPTDIDNFVTTSSFNSYTSSNDSKVNSLINHTSSYLTTASVIVNSISSSYSLFAVSASYETNTIISSSHSDFASTASYITSSNIRGTVASASYSISASWTSQSFNSTSASYVPNLYPVNTSSFITNNQTSSMTVASSSYATFALSASYETNIIVSSSHSDSASYALSASYVPNLYPVNLTGYTLTSSFNNYTSSNDAKVNSLISHTSSYLTTRSVISSSISASYSPKQLPDITDDTDNHQVHIGNNLVGGDLIVNGVIANSNTDEFSIGAYGLNSYFNAGNGGNFGIGTNNPQYNLDVAGAIGNSAGDLNINVGSQQTDNTGYNVYIEAGATNDPYNQPGGNLYLDGGFSNLSDAGNVLIGTTHGSNVGIGAGQTNPQYHLDVAGDINFATDLLKNGSTYIPNNAVSASYAPFPTDIDNYVTTSSFNNYTSSNDAKVSGLLNATSSYVTNSKTSSMTVATASYVKLSVSASYITSSNIVGTVNSSSYSATSSYLIGYVAPTLVSSSISSSWVSASVFITTAQTASYITASNVAGLTTTLINSSSYALSSSYAPLILPSQISITGITASLSGTSSWSNNSISASYITASNISGIVNSSSYATSSSYSSGSVIGSGITNVVSITSASYAALGTPNPTTLYIVNDISQPYSASYSINASTSSYSNGVKSNFTLQTNNYQIQPTDCCIIMSGSTTLSASLPSSLSVGSQYSIKNGGSANCILTSSVVIDNSNSWTINPLSSITVVSSTTQYYII